MKSIRWLYPSLVGLLLGLLQTGLFFQLSFMLSSGIRTFLMITVCWLLGSLIGIRIAKLTTFHLNGFVLLAVIAYFGCVLLLGIAPFNTQLWILYAVLIALSGLYPGVFFARFAEYYRARELFFRENNGFILGLVVGTLAFLLVGRAALWILPVLLAALVMVCTKLLLVWQSVPEPVG
jgi:hypothetical protein